MYSKVNRIVKSKEDKDKFRLNFSGFTLIELMVVVAILTFIILGLVTFFSGGARSWISGQNQLQAQREARIAVDRMSKELRGANKVTVGTLTEIEVSYPTGFGKDEVTFKLENGSIKRITNDGSNIILDNIPEGCFNITYWGTDGSQINDSSEFTKASKITLYVQVDVDNDDNPDITVETDVKLRNYNKT